MEKYTDIEIIAFVKEGNMQAFQQLYTRYWKQLYYTACRKIKRKEDVSDIIQELFTDLWHRRQNLHIRDSVGAYLFTALKFKICDFYVAASRHETQPLSVVPEEKIMEAPATASVHHHELQEILDQEVENLPQRMREIYVMSREKDMSAEEIAQALSISVQTVRNQLSTSMKKIRLTLSERYAENLQ